METIDYISLIISGAGVLATSTFNFLLWKATKSAADTARETLELNKQLSEQEEKRQKEFNEIRKKQLAREIWRESEKAYKAMVDVDPLNILRKLVSAPTQLSVEKHEIIKYFSKEQSEIIFEAWDTYSNFKQKKKQAYRINGITIIIDDLEKNSVLKEVEPIIAAFNKLENMIKYQVLKEAS